MAEISTSMRGKIAVVKARGKLTKAAELLDTGEVASVNSTGIGGMVVAYINARKWGGVIILAGGKEKFRDILQLTNLVTIFDVYDSADQAMAHLEASEAS